MLAQRKISQIFPVFSLIFDLFLSLPERKSERSAPGSAPAIFRSGAPSSAPGNNLERRSDRAPATRSAAPERSAPERGAPMLWKKA